MCECFSSVSTYSLTRIIGSVGDGVAVPSAPLSSATQKSTSALSRDEPSRGNTNLSYRRDADMCRCAADNCRLATIPHISKEHVYGEYFMMKQSLFR